MRLGLWFILIWPSVLLILKVAIEGIVVLDMDAYKTLICDMIICTVLMALTAWSFTHCKNLSYSINDYTYSLTEFSEKDGGG